jgi:hypothetical protein
MFLPESERPSFTPITQQVKLYFCISYIPFIGTKTYEAFRVKKPEG